MNAVLIPMENILGFFCLTVLQGWELTEGQTAAPFK